MTSTTTNRSPNDVAATTRRKRGKRILPTVQEEQQLPDASSSAYIEISTYRTAKPAFDHQIFLLRRLIFINAKKTK